MGKINRIQLRGISRTPSDKMTEDGGVAESLNVYLDSAETAPVLEPEDITAKIGIPDVSGVERIFIHKAQSTENYILMNSSSIWHYDNGVERKLVSLEEGETVSDITSVGNTVIVATNLNMRYILYKGGKYQYLGNSIPKPVVEYRCQETYNGDLNTPMEEVRVYNEGVTTGLSEEEINIRMFDEALWAEAVEDTKVGRTNSKTTALSKINQEFWDSINKKARDVQQDGMFVFPFLARFAVKLYDGSYIHQSVPILLGAGHERFIDIMAYRRKYSTQNESYSAITAKFHNAFTAELYIQWADSAVWSDVVESIDVFISSDICYPSINAKFENLQLMSSDSGTTDAGLTYEYKDFLMNFFNDGLSDQEAMENELLSKSNFYKVASFRPEEVHSKGYGFDLNEAMKGMTQDLLLTRERLPDNSQADIQILPSRLYSYNNRLLAVGKTRSLSDGHVGLQSMNIIWKKFPDTEYQGFQFAYFIDASDGERHKVVYPTPFGTYMMDGKNSRPYGFMAHPDARCKKVEIRRDDGPVYTVDMKPHPFLNCAYAYWGLEKTIEDLPTVARTQDEFLAGQSKTEEDAQRLYQSEANNPFYFPLSGSYSLSDKVLGVATASTALSQGQFGQFPLYVFTKDGVWAMETAADGRLVNSKPLSREVCSNPDSITPMDQAVLFVSDKGLMLLQGSEITELSPNMNGKHCTINESAKVIIDGQPEFADFVEVITDDTPFMHFMRFATIGYDYQGKRIICFNETKKYQYVYKLDTQTWHKLYHSDAMRAIRPLNSYPRCEVMATTVSGMTKIIDYSTSLDGTKKQLPEKGVIVTRPFDLQEPDVLKTITDIRVRGQLAKGAVKFILQGSQDGINFYTISTLRGKAWKMFRMIILVDLDTHERISWVDIMYDTKFTNRLR